MAVLVLIENNEGADSGNVSAAPKEQMTLLTEMGVIRGQTDKFEKNKYIPVDAADEDIFNPVVRRAVEKLV